VKNWVAAIIVLVGAASYGVLATFVKVGYAMGFSVAEVTGSQMFFGALILWLIGLTQFKKWTKPSPKAVLFLLGAGTLSGLTGVFYYTSLQYLPASIAIILLFQFAWIGVFYEWIIDRQRPTKQTYIVVSLIMIGTLLSANVLDASFRDLSVFGLLMGFFSAFTFAGYIYVSGKVSTELSPWLRSPLMVTGAFIIIFIIFPPTFFTSGVLFQGLAGIAVSIAIFGAVLPTICFTFGVPKTGIGMATILSSIELPVAILMAWAFLSEEVILIQWLGVSLILIAIALEKINKSFDMVFRK
jgi:drug/metabolite transporter (DMT)-like permease